MRVRDTDMQHHILRYRLSSGITGLHIDMPAICSVSIGWTKRECCASKDIGTELLEGNQFREVNVLVAIFWRRHGERDLVLPAYLSQHSNQGQSISYRFPRLIDGLDGV